MTKIKKIINKVNRLIEIYSSPDTDLNKLLTQKEIDLDIEQITIYRLQNILKSLKELGGEK